MSTIEIHPACLIMPPMEDDDFAKLKEDISGFGLRHPIILYQGKILDGRHRYKACIELGIEPVFEEWSGGSSVAEFVLGENLYRRHLSASQKAIVAVRSIEYHIVSAAARKRQGSTDIHQNEKGKSAAFAARNVGVSTRMVERAIFVQGYGTEQDVLEVASGEVSLKAKESEIKQRVRLEGANASENAVPAHAWCKMTIGQREACLSTYPSRKLEYCELAGFSWSPISVEGITPIIRLEAVNAPIYQHGRYDQNTILVCSDCDVFDEDLPEDWPQILLNVCEHSPNFEFLFWTRNPEKALGFRFPDNCWVGADVNTQKEMDVAERIFKDVDATVKWISVEPMLEPIMPKDAASFDWYVIGGASANSNQAGFVPPADWVFRLALAAHDAGKKTFIKTNFWQSGRPQEFPETFDDLI